MIDRRSGHLLLAPTASVRAGDSMETVRAVVPGGTNEVRDMGNGWKWLVARNVHLGPDWFHFHFYFYENRLRMVSLGVSRTRTALLGSWADWSERAERQRAEELKAWVRAEVGREGRFPWGTITADYDEKSASSGITINYD
ncbi:hypothetical protein ACFP2F_22525 [Hymenobacter artigasi]|uniref:Uncharacterized protein n=1 Tax=Hymenobacter artigasi TaxID=2719616 RepID=A0ABX1HQ43_9BACT|nr:hypothetical protein [Hymenobacter artigasi]NKI92020.1 hypothetical protein [Hymenobacter artigasi]